MSKALSLGALNTIVGENIHSEKFKPYILYCSSDFLGFQDYFGASRIQQAFGASRHRREKKTGGEHVGDPGEHP